ncbi:glucose 1-dehydrogenase-like [Colias croceus]|uniref:glucose 1-dehydrogenase-like n=1 Tax=Colias crocea TaxID=72248 RepID=UPI001E280827|nr:glucose 1-dehydrogenase-like [Colias croceus]
MFNDKVVILTGASAGIGATCATRFATLNAKLALVGRNVDNLNNTAVKCEEISGSKPLTIRADISVEEDVSRIIEETIACYGRIDVLVNNAGFLIMAGYQSDASNLDKLMATNVRGTYLLTQKAIPYLIENKGNVVNISSVVSTVPIPNMMLYCMTKAALDMFTKCLAIELAPKGVRVNAVNPGPVNTNLFTRSGFSDAQNDYFIKALGSAIPMKKVPTSEDVAKLITFLASQDAQSITGTCNIIDCGLHLGNPANL